MPDKAQSIADPNSEFADALNRHGYGFQQAIAKRVAELGNESRTRWVVDTTEFPVAAGDVNTHIDLVLRSNKTDTYLIGECKRVDPAMARWCFARTYPWGSGSNRNKAILEQFVFHGSSKLQSTPLRVSWSTEPFQVGVEVRTRAKGDGVGGKKDAISDSATQSLRGASGLANYFFAQDFDRLSGRTFRLIPTVFTTAELWITDLDLRTTDLRSGNVSKEQIKAKAVGWLWFNHNLSPTLRHRLPGSAIPSGLAEALEAESSRSVAIVNPGGLDEFLRLDFSP